MLSLAKLYAGQQRYYQDAVARGLEDYYSGAGERPGRWVGRAAARLGLAGDLDSDALDAILHGRDPKTGTRLTDRTPKIIGYDATFCAPKSVSLLYGLGTPEVAQEVAAAHDAAVDAALRALEDVACRVRRGRGGATVIEADGFVAAGYRHRASRAGDPHLHTHVLIAHPGFAAVDGRWTALDGRRLFPWAKPVGHLYETQLRAELSRRLGVEWGPVRNGIADIAAVPPAVLRAFSQRRTQIEAHLDERGQGSAKAAQVAAYATRQPKAAIGSTDLFERWRTRAGELGVDPRAVGRWTGSGRTLPPPSPAWTEALFDELAGPAGLTARRSTFDRRSVVMAVADAHRHGADIDTILDRAGSFVGSDRVVALPVAASSGHVLCRRDGTSVALEADLRRFSTPELLALERRLLSDARRRSGEECARLDPVQIRLTLLSHPRLSPEQRGLVAAVTGSGHGVDVVVGAAGTGKTAALAAARAAWEAGGHRVVGCALAARAAAELRDRAGIPSSTLTGFWPRPSGPVPVWTPTWSCWTKPEWWAPARSPGSSTWPPSTSPRWC